MLSVASFSLCQLFESPFSQRKISWRVKCDCTFAGGCGAVQPLNSLFACQVGAASDPVVCSLLLLFLSFFLPLSYLLLYFNSPV